MASKVVRASAQTNILTGLVTVTIKVPGTYQGINFKDPAFQGRIAQQLGFFFSSPDTGDVCTDLYVEDTDGKIAVGLRGQFPSYPKLNFIADDSMPSENQGFFIPSMVPFQITPPGGGKPIPSEMYVVAKFSKSSPILDTIYVNIVWDDLKG